MVDGVCWMLDISWRPMMATGEIDTRCSCPFSYKVREKYSRQSKQMKRKGEERGVSFPSK